MWYTYRYSRKERGWVVRDYNGDSISVCRYEEHARILTDVLNWDLKILGDILAESGDYTETVKNMMRR